MCFFDLEGGFLMTDPLTLLLQVLPIILLIGLGMFLKQIRYLTQDGVDQIKKLVMGIGLPSMLFLTFAHTTLNPVYLILVAVVFFSCLLMLVLSGWILKRLKVDNPYAPALFTGFETGMIGYALYIAVFGQAEVFRLAIVDLGQVVFVFFVLVTFIKRQNGDRPGGVELVKSFLLSPIIVAILLGIVVSASGLGVQLDNSRVGAMLTNILQMLGNLTVPLITLAIGFELQLSRATFKWPLLAAVVRMLVLFGLATLINRVLIRGVLQLEPQFETALMTMFLLPPPFVIPILMLHRKGDAERAEGQRQFVLSTLSIHMVLSLFAFILVIA